MAVQRFTRNRRPVKAAQQWKPQLLTWKAGENTETTLALEIEGDLRLFGTVPSPESVTARSPSDEVYPCSAVTLNADGTVVVLEWDSLPPATLLDVTVPAWLADLRTAQGGWLAPGATSFTTPA